MFSVYRKIFDLLDRRERIRFGLLLGMILVMSLLEVAGVASIIPFLAVLSDPQVIHQTPYLQVFYEGLGFQSDRAFLLFLGIVVFGLVVFGLAFKAVTLYALTRFSTMRNYSISTRLFGSYLSQPFVWFLSRHSADLGKTILSEVDQVIGKSIIPALTLLAHITVVFALAVLLFLVDPVVVAIVIAVLGGSYGLIYFGIRGLLTRIGEQRVHANRERYQAANEAMGGIKDVKMLGLEDAYLRRFRRPAAVFARTQALAAILGTIPRYVLEAVAFGGMLIIVLVLLARAEGRLEEAIPVLGVFAFAGVRMFPAMQKVYDSFTKLRFGGYALDALHRELTESRPAHPLPAQKGEALDLKERLTLENIYYSYPSTDKPALNGLSMSIDALTTVGVVGGSGAGKTTAVDVILGLLWPQDGVLRVDGVVINEHNRRAWQRSIGYVPQHIFLADETVAANIAFGVPRKQIDMDAVKRAARLSELDRFVTEELPQGYETMVGERGVRLSGGQRQRIGIARALYYDPSILVFDEATSALDNLTERAVIDAVHNLSGAKTIIMIAHRLTTVQRCNEIILLEEGQIAARGSYEELMEESEAFQRLASAAA